MENKTSQNPLNKISPVKFIEETLFCNLDPDSNDQNPMSSEDGVIYQGQVQNIIKNLQGKILTLLEANMEDERRLNAMKSIINGYFSESLSSVTSYAGHLSSYAEKIVDVNL